MYISDHLSRSALPNRRMEKKERDDYEVFTVHAEEQIMKEIDDIDQIYFTTWQMQCFRKWRKQVHRTEIS